MSLTLEQVRQHLRYDPQTGVFTRLTSNHYRWPVGSVAGAFDRSTGYVRIRLLGMKTHGHRLAFFYMNGEWPEHDVDHRNGIRHDNRFENLRLCTRAENVQNSVIPKTNTTGFMGVSFDSRCNKFYARFQERWLGTFESPEVAHDAYLSARRAAYSFQPEPRIAKCL